MTGRHQLPTLLGRHMWAKLNQPRNVAKGDNWRGMTMDEMWLNILTEVDELRVAIMREGPEAILSEIADVANFLAMLADKVESEGS